LEPLPALRGVVYTSRGVKWILSRRRKSLISAREQYSGPSKKFVSPAVRGAFPEDFDTRQYLLWAFFNVLFDRSPSSRFHFVATI